MILILEISLPFQWRPGCVASDFGDVKCRRVWWLWFAVTYCPLALHTFYNHIVRMQTYWR